MPRPRICRMVGREPGATFFKPAGVRMAGLEEIVIAVEEIEAIRLKDLLGLDQEECARRMGISQPTFHRLVSSARRSVAEAIVEGKAIRIGGGSYGLGIRRGGNQ